MKIVNTFVKGLYSFKYEENSEHELKRLLNEWNDVEKLDEFFNENKKDLSFYEITPADAVIETQVEAASLSDALYELHGKKNSGLDALFINLNNNEYKQTVLTKKKARRRWLR